MHESPDKIRLDKWLWHARFFKTRSLSAKAIAAGHVRVNSTRAAKPAVMVGVQDVLTFPQADCVRVVRILALGDRRGPASEARALYEDLAAPPPLPERPVAAVPKFDGKGRPTKRDRRKLDLKTSGALD